MKKLAFTAALLGATALMAPSAHATVMDWDEFFDIINGCDNLCDPNRADFRQDLYGIQEAINQIVNIKDANDVVQKAVNAGNLVTAYTEDGDGVLYHQLSKDLGTVIQVANVNQSAKNLIDGNKFSTFGNLSQAATNVVNSVTGKTAWNISQNVVNSQLATNTIYGGSGGYDATGIADWTDADEVLTQVAVNASNLVDIATLKNDINQVSNATQDAINVAYFESSPQYTPGWFGILYPTHHWNSADVSDFGQSATNVTNSVTLGQIDFTNACACGFEITQYANANQYASNVLDTMGNVNNIIQSATNVANSISVPSAP